jgi:hypothetical protein
MFLRGDTSIESLYVSMKIQCQMQKLSLYEATKMWVSLTVTFTDILHVFIKKCKSRISIHVKSKHKEKMVP